VGGDVEKNTGNVNTIRLQNLRFILRTVGSVQKMCRKEEVIVLRKEGEIRKKLKELEENKEEITQTSYSEQKRIGLHADIKMLRWVLGEK